MAISAKQHLKNTDVPAWVVTRLRQYVDAVGGKKEFVKRFGISESYLSLLWNGKRHPPIGIHGVLHIRVVTQPLVYEDLQGK